MHSLFIVWTDINETNIPIIDEQHRGIVSIINSLYFYMERSHAGRILMPVMEMLLAYTKIHFQIEEKMLETVDYPDTVEHKKHHAGFVSAVNKFINNSQNYNETEELLTFLKLWWLDHINREDRAYAIFIHEQLKINPGLLDNR